MKPSKNRQVAVSSSHHIKVQRRCSFCVGPSQLDTSLRFTSIFVIVIAFCEFSGISQAIMDAYTSATNPTIRFGNEGIGAARVAGANASNIVKPSFVNMHEQHHLRGNTLSVSTKRRDLHNLYTDLDPSMTMQEFLETTEKPTNPGSAKPKFMLEMHWADENFRDKICRIHNACINRDGSFLVHPWMKTQRRYLMSCGVTKIAFMKSEADYNSSDENSGLDLYGSYPSRYHIPHFLTDTLPMIYASEILRPTFSRPSAIKCVCEMPGGQRCSDEAIKDKLHPSLYAEERIGAMKISSWVPQLAAMLPGRPYMNFYPTMFKNSSQPVCFRSIVAYNQHSFFRHGQQWFGKENEMFLSHGIDRGSAQSDLDNPQHSKPQGCQKNITLLNRMGWKRRGNFLLGRDVVNIQSVVDRVKEIGRSKDNNNLDLRVNVEYFDNASFIEQVDVMQNADVLLGVHGAGLGNMIFARQDVPILEVLPFGYYAGPFQAVAQTLRLRYFRIIAEPDTDNLRKCLAMRAEKLGDPKVLKDGMILWNEAVKKRRDGDMYHLMAHTYTDPELVSLKLCVRSQRMKVDVDATATKLVQMAQSMCRKENVGPT